MSLTTEIKKTLVPAIIQMKQQGRKISALTAYDYLLAALLDKAGIDIILVGDSGAMVFSGHENTLPLTMDEAIYHTRAVCRGVEKALVVADMPFMSFQISVNDTLVNAGRFFKETTLDAVKLEGGEEIAESVFRLVQCGMPVMGHLGLRPQMVKQLGGYGVQAKSEKDSQKLLSDAKILEQAGAFAIVLEKIPATVAGNVAKELKIPVIGIGAGPYCDGQILVTPDMLGLFEKFKPRFVRRYAELANVIVQACEQYSQDIKNGTFPSADECF